MDAVLDTKFIDNPKWEIFCQAWVDTLGNGTQSALEAFDISGKEFCETDWKDLSEENKISRRKAEATAANMAREYLRKPEIRKRCSEIMEERGFNDAEVEKEHYKLIKQDSDWGVKRAAIRDYYQLKGKLTDHVDLTTKGEKISTGLTDEEKAKLQSIL